MAIRIVIAEHDSVTAEWLRDEIGCMPDHEVVGTAGIGWEAVTAVGRLEPDLLLLRMELPGLSAPEVLRVVKWYRPATKVIVLSPQEEESAVLDMLKLGARGYLVYGDRAHLRKAILAVEKGEVWARRRVVAAMIEDFIRLAHLSFEGAPEVGWSNQVGP